ncbi:hypothetical protein VFPBJ_07793 [Purpureocillium lilacinum]|uniref:Uncharacterized protein n=1 Tax=Purpureocillium lilacinum TaxID=33203 RepID=A0A179GIW9_PURLI|nr:hypothetical protein VFPBJ_07793 [Purpureocillium lilacinum]
MGDYRQGYADTTTTTTTTMPHEGEEMMDRRRYDRSPEGFTYEFRDVDLTNGEKGSGETQSAKRKSRFCPAWLRDGDGIDQGWKPFSMTTPILLSLALLSLLVAAGIETLAQRSAARGGLALAPTQDDIPAAAMFAYQYVPNVAAAVYSLVWNWVDLDVKRMQPWFELSQADGARGEDSLLLDYPVEFLAFVPLKAAKKRHWPVFLSGTIMMLVFWVITPLQSAILGTGIALRTSPMNIVNRSQLLPVAEQAAKLGPEALMIGYSMGWLNGTPPQFTTHDYALLPFYIDDDPSPKKSAANWTATTTKLTTELTCWPAQASRRGPNTTMMDFLNGQGCNATINFDYHSTTYMMQYVGFYGSAYSSYFLAGPQTCPFNRDVVHQFLAIWAKLKTPPGPDASYNLTAMFCQSHYYKQDVRVTINAETKVADPNSFQALSERKVLSEDEFNSTAFDFLVANGMDYGAESKIRDRPFQIVVEQTPRLRSNNLSWPVDPAIGYALAGQNLSMEAYSDPKTLQMAFDRATKYLFSAAVSRLLVNTTDFSDRTATSTYPLSGILVSRSFSAAVEALLTTCAILTLALLWLCRKAPCHLRANPNSISRLNDIFRNSPRVLDAFRKLDNAGGKSLHNLFRDDNFRLSRFKGHDGYELSLEYTASKDRSSKECTSRDPEPYYDPIRPFALTRKMGIIFLVIMLSAAAVIAWLKSAETSNNGLSRPTDSFEVLQLLENYIPTAFATLVEPFWVMLNRLICVMQPFQDLWAGKARPAKSIDTTYSAIPPQLTVWRALKARHFVLVAVCLVTLAANLLGIGLGALFNENIAIVKYQQDFVPLRAPLFSNSSIDAWKSLLGSNTASTRYSDHFTAALANLTYGTPLPPWVSREYFFMPHSIADVGTRRPTDTYTVQTRGLGASFNCTPLPTLELPDKPAVALNLSCSDPRPYLVQVMREDRKSIDRPTGFGTMTSCGIPSTPWGETRCADRFMYAWGRSSSSEKGQGVIRASFAECKSHFKTAMFNVTVDAAGNVLSYNQTGDMQPYLDYEKGEAFCKNITFIADDHFTCTHSQWRNDTTADDWMSYLMSEVIGNRTFLRPNTPVPDPASLSPVLNEVYGLTFSLLLGLGWDLVFDATADKSAVTGWRHTEETKIFLDTAPLIITLAILSLNVAVAILFYARVTAFVLPRMPTSIGSILAYVAPSRAVSVATKGGPWTQNRTFSFGRYKGVDGLVHIGIELDPHVVPIDPKALRGNAGLRSRFWRRLTRRKNSSEALTTWL